MGANCSISEVGVIIMDESVIQNVLGLYEEKIDSLDISPKEKTALKLSLKDRYTRMRYDPGDAVGVIAAQSISEPATQTTLRSYHRAAGAGLNITQGLPRILEIFDARKVPVTPSMKIYLKKEYNKKDKAVEIASSIKETDLKHIMVMDSLDLANMALEVELDKDIIKQFNIIPDKIISAVKRKVKNVNASVDGNKLIFEIKKDKVTIKDLQALRFKLRDVHVKGIKGITHCIVEKVGDEYVLYTLGIQCAGTKPGAEYGRLLRAAKLRRHGLAGRTAGGIVRPYRATQPIQQGALGLVHHFCGQRAVFQAQAVTGELIGDA